MMLLLLLAGMLALFTIGMPIAWAMALASVAYLWLGLGIPLQGMVQRLIGGIDTFALLAIPFFVFAGNLMNAGGITDRLVSFSRAVVGHITGGLGHVVVVTNMLMAGMSGSGVADASGTGTVLMPAMKRAGFQPAFAAALVGASATIGPIIPPSIPLIVYGAVASVSIGRLLLAGAIPGLVIGICLMVTVYIVAKRRGYPSEPRASLRQIARASISVLPPLGMPVIVLGGIILGVMTPTEAAVASAAYAFVLGCFVYREIKFSDLPGIIVETAMSSAAIIIIISAAQPFGWILAYEQAPLHFVDWIASMDLARWQILALLMIGTLVAGCFMEGMAILIVATPVIMPMLQHAQIDPVHFGVALTLNIMIGNITPPIGMILYVVSSLGKVSITAVTKEIWPFFLALVLALILVTYIPSLALWLPGILMSPG